MKLGVIGGLGPMATAYFMELVTQMTSADCDQDHLEMIIHSCPSIPDRTAFILGKSQESPLQGIVRIGKQLEKQQVTTIAMPCMTAHYFHKEIQDEISIPVIHGIRETALVLKEAGMSRIGVMATDGTIESGIFQSELEALGMEVVLPSEEIQQRVMQLIYQNIKAGKSPDMDSFSKIREYFYKEGQAQVVVLGCTELSVIKKDYELGDGFIDAMEVLARRAILDCGKRILPQYVKLFTPFA